MFKPHKVDIMKPVLVPDGLGGHHMVPTARAKSIRCFIVPDTSSREEIQNRQSEQQVFSFYTDASVDIFSGDSIIGRNKPYRDQEFEIMGIVNGGGLNRIWELKLQKVS